MATNSRDIAGYVGAKLLGRGGFGAVYQASDEDHGRDVAIKVLQGTLGEAERRRFDRERQTMGRLGSHPSIIPVFESGYTPEGEGYIVMELATGGSLKDRLVREGRIPWQEAAEMMAAVATATQAAHDNGVLHRDIKPDNILIDQFGNPKLSDFGIAAVATNATSTTSTTATLAHAAPELLQGRASSTAMDIYAVGSTLHALVTGLPPFVRAEDESVTPMITRALTEPPPDLRSYGVPDNVAVVVERALSKEPADRQATAAELANELRYGIYGEGLGGRPAAAPNPPDANPNDTVVDASFLPPGPGSNERPPAFPPPTGQPGINPNSFPQTGSPSQHFSPSGATPPPGLEPSQNFSNQQPAQFQPSFQPTNTPPHGFAPPGTTDSSSGSKGKIFAVAGVGILALLAGLGLVLFLGSGGDDDPIETTTAPTLSTVDTSVVIDCPDQVRFGVRTVCGIDSANANSGQWSLPSFSINSQPISVNQEHSVFLMPENVNALGETFTMTATVNGDAGAEATASHQFTVVNATVAIDCPETVTLNVQVQCTITTEGAVSGTWMIPGFDSGTLASVPGTSPVNLTANNANVLGETFTLTATAIDSSGAEWSSSKSFTIVDG